MADNAMVPGDSQELSTVFTGDASGIVAAAQEAQIAIKEVGEQTEKTSKSTSSGSSKMSDAFSEVKSAVSGLRKAFKALMANRIGKYLSDSIKESISYIERLNLFRVAVGDSADEMTRFINKMSEALGLDSSTLIKTTGVFRLLASSIGLANEQADLLAKNFTKAAVDIASLYELPVADAVEKLRAGLVGLPKPLRDIGIVLTVARLEQEAMALGITESVRNMSEANKVGLRYIAVMKQMKAAMGDFANTIESPANQLRIMQEQLTRLSRAIGNLFVNALAKILPYLNGFIMALRSIIELLANLLGYQDIVFEGTVKDAANGMWDMADATSETVAEMKKLQAPFDELNILTDDTDLGVGMGGIDLGEMDPRIIAAMKEYDNLMDSVRMKANDIRDRIMEILGFTKQINEATGEITWTWNFQDMLEGLKQVPGMLAEWWTQASPGEKLAAIFVTGWVGWLLSKGIALLLTPFKVLGKLLWAIIGPLLAKLGSLITGAITKFTTGIGAKLAGLGSTLSTPFLVMAAVIALAIAALWDLWKNSAEFRNNVKESLSDIWGYLKEIFSGVKENIARTIDDIKTIIDFLKWVFMPFFKDLELFLSAFWDSFKDFVEGTVYAVLDFIEGSLQILSGIVNGNLEDIFKGICKVLDSILNATTTLITAMANFIIRILNGLIERVNKHLKFETPEWMDKYLGISFEWKASIPKIPLLEVPRAANGGTFASGDLFRAGENGRAELVGDFGGNTTIMPLENTNFISAMQAAVAQGVMEAQSQRGDQTSGGDQVIKVIIGGREWDTMVYKSGERGKKSVGKLITGGAFNA
jgi:phage-related protein